MEIVDDAAGICFSRWTPPPQPQHLRSALRHRPAQCSAQPRQPSQQAGRDVGDQVSSRASGEAERIGADSNEQPSPSAHQPGRVSSNGAHSDDAWSDPGDRNGGATAPQNGSSDSNGQKATPLAARKSAQARATADASTNGSTPARSTASALAEAVDKDQNGASPGVEAAEVDVGEAVDVAAALGKSGWDGLPARYKMVVASSVAFMVCNMVRHMLTHVRCRVCTHCGYKRGPRLWHASPLAAAPCRVTLLLSWSCPLLEQQLPLQRVHWGTQSTVVACYYSGRHEFRFMSPRTPFTSFIWLLAARRTR